MVHDLEASEMGEWEGPRILREEFEGVSTAKVEKPEGYDLWANLSLLKADITFGQLLEISPMARKTLKEGMPMTRRNRRAKTIVVARVQLQGHGRVLKAVEIEDKIVPNVLVDGRSGLIILREQTMKKLGLGFTGPSSFIINMPNQILAVPLAQMKDCRISIEREVNNVTFHVIRMHSHKDAFLILLGMLWLRMANAIADWGNAEPSITYGPKENRAKVPIGPMASLTMGEITTYSDEEVEENQEEVKNEKLVGVVRLGEERVTMDSRLSNLGPSLYHLSDNGEYARWLKDYPDSICDVMVTSHLECLKEGRNVLRKEERSLLEPCEVLTEEDWLHGGLTSWVDGIEKCSVGLVQIDGTQDLEGLCDAALLE